MAISHLDERRISLFAPYLLTLLCGQIVSPFSDLKMFANIIGLFIVFVAVYESLYRLPEKTFQTLQQRSSVWFPSILAILAAILLPSVLEGLSYGGGFTTILSTTGDWHSVMAVGTTNLGFEKQAAGNFGIIIASFLISFFSRLSRFNKCLCAAAVVCLLPIGIGIRTLGLALMLFILLYFVCKYGFLSLLPAPIFAVIAFYEKSAIWDFVTNNFDRLPSMIFVVSSLEQYPFGFGLGGYHKYVMQENDLLVSLYGSEAMRTSFWVAPESDIVFLVGSFGFLSLIFFVPLLLLIGRAIRLIAFYSVQPLEKMLLLSSCLLVLAGVSQDNIISLTWFCYVAAGSAMTARLTGRAALNKVTPCVSPSDLPASPQPL